MNSVKFCLLYRCVVIVALVLSASQSIAQPARGYEPRVGQAGKDVVWVPTPDELVEKMLNLGNVTASDYVIDLGSGDGRTVILAAKRGARAHGIEYNPEMVELSKQNAAKAGVGERATFAKEDLFESDFSKASVNHHVSPAADQCQTAAEDPRFEAGHTHRVELIFYGRMARGRQR
jgi:SAM-dependent methyltransferase